MTRRVPLLVLGLLAAAHAGAGIGPQPLPVPRPAIDSLEPADQEQLRDERSRLDELLADPGRGPTERAGAYGRLGQLYLLYDLIDGARACFLNASSLAPRDFRWHYYLGVLYTREGELDQARTSLERAAAIQQADLATRLRLGEVRLDLGEPEAAAQAFASALELDAESAAARHGLGRVAFARGDFERAVAELETALALQPEATSIHHPLGLALRELGDLERARSHLARNRFDRVVFPDPLVDGLGELLRSARAHLKAGNRAARSGDLEAAIGEYRRAAAIDPQDPLIRYNLGWALSRSGREEEAIGHLRAALAADPDYRNAHYNLGASLARKGLYQEAISHYERALEIDPEDQVAHLELAGVLQSAGYLNRAMGELEALLATLVELGTERELEARAHHQLAVLLEQVGSEEAALEHYRAATRTDPDLLDAHLRLGFLLGRAGELDQAADRFGRAIEIDPGEERAHVGRGMALTLAGEYLAARQALESSLQALPQSLALADHLARLLATCSDPQVRDGERALELALAVMRTSQTVDHAETVAMALAEVGRFPDAVELQRRLIAETEKAGRQERLEPMQRRLALYASQRPCREPWKER